MDAARTRPHPAGGYEVLQPCNLQAIAKTPGKILATGSGARRRAFATPVAQTRRTNRCRTNRGRTYTYTLIHSSKEPKRKGMTNNKSISLCPAPYPYFSNRAGESSGGGS